VGFLENVRAAGEEQRVIGGLPWQPWNSPYMRFDLGGPAHPSRSYHSPESALGLPALYAGTKLLADSAASLPLRVFQKYNSNGNPARRLYTGPSIFDQPSLTGTQFDWIFSSMVSVILQGNAWGYITGKDGYGFPTGIEWIPCQDVYVHEAVDAQSMNPLDSKVYVYGREMKWYGADSELFHITGFKLPGRIQGLSLLMHAALTITAGAEAQRYGTDWYKSGGFPPGTFQNSEIEIDATQAAEMRNELVKSLRRREPLVYGRDWDYKPVTVPPSEAQFIDAIQLNAAHFAAMLNLPANRLGGTTGDSLHYSSQAQDALQIIEALRPWLVRFEQAYSTIIPRGREAVFNTDALLKTDLQTRMQIYQIQRDIGYRNVDELRALEDLPPQGDGVGSENMPLQLMVALGTRAGAIPKSLMKSVVLEMDIATDRLIKLEKTMISQGKLPQAAAPAPMGAGGPGAAGGTGGGAGANVGTTAGGNLPSQGSTVPDTNGGKVAVGKPNQPLPLAQDPASFLASLIGVQRSYPDSPEVRDAVKEICVRILEKAANIERHEGSSLLPASDLMAPWTNSTVVRDIVLG
jgi:HK97 family phage portal protein